MMLRKLPLALFLLGLTSQSQAMQPSDDPMGEDKPSGYPMSPLVQASVFPSYPIRGERREGFLDGSGSFTSRRTAFSLSPGTVVAMNDNSILHESVYKAVHGISESNYTTRFCVTPNPTSLTPDSTDLSMLPTSYYASIDVKLSAKETRPSKPDEVDLASMQEFLLSSSMTSLPLQVVEETGALAKDNYNTTVAAGLNLLLTRILYPTLKENKKMARTYSALKSVVIEGKRESLKKALLDLTKEFAPLYHGPMEASSSSSSWSLTYIFKESSKPEVK